MSYRLSKERLDELAASGLVGFDADWAAHSEVRALVDEAQVLRAFVEHIRDGFDCDTDAHRYNTLCRCCSADAALKGENPYNLDLKPL